MSNIPDDDFIAVNKDDYFVLRVRCARCRQPTRAKGVPISLHYLGDDGRKKTANGIMFPQVDPAHYAVCPALVGPVKT